MHGIAGAAFGLVASALPLILMQLWTLRHAGMLRTRHAVSLFAVTALVTAIASLLLI